MVRGQEVKFSPREYDVLRLLVRHAGKVLTHKMILREVWGGDTDVRYLRIHIRASRRKIEPDPEQPTHIVTETGVGYRPRAPSRLNRNQEGKASPSAMRANLDDPRCYHTPAAPRGDVCPYDVWAKPETEEQ